MAFYGSNFGNCASMFGEEAGTKFLIIQNSLFFYFWLTLLSWIDISAIFFHIF